MRTSLRLVSVLSLACAFAFDPARDDAPLQRAFITGEGWTALTLNDFINVNGEEGTWSEHDGVIACSGKPLGGARTRTTYTNFEMVVEWRHLAYAGNSGIFVWCPQSAFTDLPAGTLPRSGVEVQVLDPGYEENWEKSKGAPSDWFTSHGDLFPLGVSTMTAFHPQMQYPRDGASTISVGSPESSRSFPTKRLTRPVPEWNHYYLRAINGEIRLWVNGEEVNGGTACSPATGYLALEAEGSRVEYRNLRIRELP